MKALVMHKDLNHKLNSFGKKFIQHFNNIFSGEQFCLYQIFPLWAFYSDDEFELKTVTAASIEGVSLEKDSLFFDLALSMENTSSFKIKKICFAKEIDGKDLSSISAKADCIVENLKPDFLFPVRITVMKTGQCFSENNAFYLTEEKWIKLSK